MLIFQEPVLREQLERLPPCSRVIFAASCAQRLAHAFYAFARQNRQDDLLKLFDNALNYAWMHVFGTPESETINQLITDVMESIPDEDAPGWTLLSPYADDALSAVVYCLRCLQSGHAQEAAWAARRVYEALDHFVRYKENVSSSDPEVEMRISSNTVIQKELQRQARDITDLHSAGHSLPQEFIDKLRRRSVAEQAITIDL